jgi:hypothetical protein
MRKVLVRVAAAGLGVLMSQSALAQNAIPNFGGLWTRLDSSGGGRSFDNPETGQGPVQEPPAEAADDGYWIGDHESPILQAHAAAQVKERADFVRSGGIDLPPWSLCWPIGVPQTINLNEPMQFLQTPDKITILYQRDHLVRHVYLNEKQAENPEPSWYGHSVGHYEGTDTLVIDTIGQNGRTWVDRFGTPGSESMRVVERYRMLPDGQHMEVTFTVEDPATFNMPWGGRALYERDGIYLEEVVCAENNKDASTGLDYPIPMTDLREF